MAAVKLAILAGTSLWVWNPTLPTAKEKDGRPDFGHHRRKSSFFSALAAEGGACEFKLHRASSVERYQRIVVLTNEIVNPTTRVPRQLVSELRRDP